VVGKKRDTREDERRSREEERASPKNLIYIPLNSLYTRRGRWGVGFNKKVEG
jgi:hypothetical protein